MQRGHGVVPESPVCSIFVIETHPVSGAGKWVTVLMIVSGIILIPWQVSRIAKEWIHIATKKGSLPGMRASLP
jgi:hypothetical protein